MKKILIVSAHFPPSNLAAVHRSRLFAQHLPSLGWNPIILTVHEDFYEEDLDWKLHDLLSSNLRIEKVSAFSITKTRLIGDIGLRAYFQLRNRAVELVRLEKIDFVFIPIPSFYMALLGPYLFRKTGVPYGIDYIDPWVHIFPGSDQLFSRHWFSTQMAKLLEPIAVKNASLVTGVSDGYFQPVLERNPHLTFQAVTAAMPYGGEESDHDYIRKSRIGKEIGAFILPPKKHNSFQFVYAGAMLPKAHKPLEEIFEALSTINLFQLSECPQTISFHFIGTLGIIKPLAVKFGLWQSVVFEHPMRIPYLDVLRNLDAADGIFILGSTEPHYTPSKIFQGVLSQKPIFAVLHQESAAVKVLEETKAGLCLLMDGEEDLDTLGERFITLLNQYLRWANTFDPSSVDRKAFDQYSAKTVTNQLVESIEKALKQISITSHSIQTQ